MICLAANADVLSEGTDLLSEGNTLLPDSDTTLKLNQADRAQFAYGTVLFDFYSDRFFGAANAIKIGQAEHILNTNAADTDLLLGNIYSKANMPAYADRIFSRIIHEDTLSSIKQRTWLSKGELYYQRGQYGQALQILQVPRQELTRAQDVERRVILSNIYLKQGDTLKASKILEQIPLDTKFSAYAFYNAGVASIRMHHEAEGIAELKRVLHIPANDPETRAIHDRTLLAIGYEELREGRHEDASKYLLQISINGPFSNQALLAMGYVHFSQWDYRKALAFWLELLKRNPADPSVQEALLLAPRAYEELHAYPEALFGYRLAAEIFRAELVKLGRIQQQSNQPGWLDQLDAHSLDTAEDPFAPVHFDGFAKKPEAAFLYHLFSEHAFTVGYTDYVQLGHLEQELKRQESELPAVEQIAEIHHQILQNHLSEWGLQFALLSNRNHALQKQFEDLQQRIHHFSSQSSFTDNASYADVTRLEQMLRIERTLNQLPPSISTALMRERLRRVKGVILWGIAHNGPLAFEQARMEMGPMATTMATLQQRIDGVRQLFKDSASFNEHFTPANFASAQQSIQHYQTLLEAARNSDAHRLLAMTQQIIAHQQKFLNTQLASALLAVARLQDLNASTHLGNQMPGQNP